MSSKLPIGVATIERLLVALFILFLFKFIFSCTPVNQSKQAPINSQETSSSKQISSIKVTANIDKKIEKKEDNFSNKIVLNKNIIVLFAKDNDQKITKQFINTFELGIYNLGIMDINLQIELFENENDLKNIIENNLSSGRVFLGPIQSK